MHFLADENVSSLVIGCLRDEGFEVVSVAETLSGATDLDILQAANVNARILITEDRDFGELVIRQKLAVHSVVLLELDRLSNAAEAVRVARIVSKHADTLEGNLVVIEPARVRVRPLPSALST